MLRGRRPYVEFGGLKETKMFLHHSLVKLSIEGSVISLISPCSGGSPGLILPGCAQKWPDAESQFLTIREGN